jgi:flagellar basal-body rod modification protein FlgD
MVDAVNGSDLRSLGLGVPQTTRGEDLGQADFLHLMVTQLKNQDPFKPLESGEFLGQLAQFGTVSGLADLQTSFNSLAGSLVSNQALQAAGLVGRAALVETSALAITAGQPVAGAVDMSAASNGVSVSIHDATGHVVRRLDLGAQPPGLAPFTWDGFTDSGVPAEAGRYTFSAEFRAGTQTEAAPTLLAAPVDSVLFDADGFSVELHGIGEVPFTAVREIRNAIVSSAAPADPGAGGN